MEKKELKNVVEKLGTVMRKYPLLTAYGYDLKKEHDFKSEREELKKLSEEIMYCAKFLKNTKRIKGINYANNSYGYKHRVEKWIENNFGKHCYISNGSFIAAALIMDFKMTVNKLNPNFNISRKSSK